MSTPLPPASIWTVLQDKPFRGMWGASFGYFTANSMMAMAAAWMMVELQASAFVVALVQTAVFLPMFVFALPWRVRPRCCSSRCCLVVARRC